MGCCAKLCSCASNLFLGVSGVVYAILGLAIIVASAATFFTAYGDIFEPLYAGIGLGGGVFILLVGIIGMLAACKRGVCWLWVFTVWTFLLLLAVLVSLVVMFRYEDLLKEASKVNAEGGIIKAEDVVSSSATAAVRELTHNAFDACNATTLATAAPYEYSFRCTDSDFQNLGSILNDVCYTTDNAPLMVNATVSSAFHQCYTGDYLKGWRAPVSLGSTSNPSSALVLRVLNTPKGLFCACSSTFINEYILPYVKNAKFVAIGVFVFFFFAFACCLAQIFRRGCCGRKERERLKEKQGNRMDAIQLSYPDDKNKKVRSQKMMNAQLGGGGYVARP